MTLTAEALRKRYGLMRDDELAWLLGEEAQLTPEAKQVLREELEKRRAAEPPFPGLGSPCPTHPEAQIQTVCARCGRFLCSRCVPSPQRGSICGDCQRRLDETPARFGLWLGLALVALFAWPLKFISSAISAVLYFRNGIWAAAIDPANPRHIPFWGTYFVWELISSLALACFSIYLLPRYWSKLRGVPRKMCLFFGATFVVTMVNFVFGAVSNPKPNVPIGAVILNVAVVGAWIRYFSKSQHVRRVFIR